MIRLANELDFPFIETALRELKAKSPAAQMQYIDDDYALANMAQAIREHRGWFCGGYFILVDIGGPWYSPKKMLIEEIILKVYPGRGKTVDDAIAALDTIAAHYGCEATVAGDTQIGYMTPRYHAAGFTTLGTQLLKENHGHSTKVHRSR